jgi:hypothetical protein
MNVVKVISTAIDSYQRRVVKFLRMGKYDVQTAVEASPYGIDSNPIKDMEAIYAQTDGRGDQVIIGYINKNKVANAGELRIYSTDLSGVEKFYVYLKNNGTLEMGGVADNAVRYSPLNTAIQQQKTDINTELGKIASAINAIVPGSYTPALISINISGSKINEIKTL